MDVRILSATHKNLPSLVENGQFRHDLFYRINVIELFIKPLRERPEDIPLLTEHILRKLPAASGEKPLSVSSQTMEALLEHSYSGNIRELENILEHAMTLCSGNSIEFEDLQIQI